MKSNAVSRALGYCAWVLILSAISPAARAELDQARAAKIWDRVIDQEIRLSVAQDTPKNFDEAVGVSGQVASVAMRLVTFHWGTFTMRSKYNDEVAIAANQIPAIKRDMKEAASQGPDALQARLDEFSSRLDESESHLKKARDIWRDYTDTDTSAAESVETGAKVVFVADAAVGTVATGGALLEIAGGASAATATTVTAVSPGLVFGAGVAGALHAPLILAATGNETAHAVVQGSTGNAGAPIDVEVIPQTPPPPQPKPEPEKPAPKPPVVASKDQPGDWAVPNTPPSPKPKPRPQPQPRPRPRPQPQPVPQPHPAPQPIAPRPAPSTPPPVVAPTAPTGAPADPAHGNGNLFGQLAGPHLAGAVGGVGDPQDEIKCDQDTQDKVYTPLARKPRVDSDGSPLIANYPDILLGAQSIYFCRVNQYFPDDPQAIFLSRLGLRAAAVGESITNDIANSCQKMADMLKETLADVKALETLDSSPQLRNLEKDLEDAQNKNCMQQAAMVQDDSLQQGLMRDLCLWKKVAETNRAGSTLGVSNILANCRGVY
jgi:outer membrane biosynthesis protein TonB